MLQERRVKLVESRGTMSNVASVAASPAAAKAGAELRVARERLGLSLQDMASSLRIRLPHLEALEAGRIVELPGHAYALAFVRTYAEALGLDAREMVRRFRNEAAGVDRRPELVFPVPMPEHGVPPGALVLLGLVLAIGVYAGWYRLSGEGRLPAETVTAIPERLASLAEQAVPMTAARRVQEAANVPPQAAPVEPPTPAGAMAAEAAADPAPPVMAISPTSAAAAQLPPRPVEATVGVASAPLLDAGRIVLRASADAWLLVKERGGATLLNRTMKPGETWPVPVRPDLLLTTGNAGGTEVVVDGVTAPSLGGNGVVRRDLPLDPDQIKEGKFASAVVPQVAPPRARQ